MTAKTFTNTAGGTWDTGTNWSGGTIPLSGDDAFINTPGTYTVTIKAVDSVNTATLNDPSATLSITSTGQLLLFSATPVLALEAGTLALAGILNSETVVDTGAALSLAGGTLDGVTWNGLLDDTAGTFGVLNIADGITVNNSAGNAPGTIDIGTLYMLNILDANTLDALTISFGNFNNEYLNGSNTLSLILGSTGTIVQSAASAFGEVSGLEFDNHGLVDADGSHSVLLVTSTTFDNLGTVLVTGTDSLEVAHTLNNTGTIAVSASGTLSTGAATASNIGLISVSSAGTFTAAAEVTGTGDITVSSLGTVDVHNVDGTVIFLDGRGILRLEVPGSYTGAIAGFQKGDKIDLPGQTVTTLDPHSTVGSTTLDVLNGSTTIASLNLIGNYTTGFVFNHATDGAGGTNITIACYAADARILTARGEVAAVSLREGDLVATASGALKPVRWVGRSGIDLGQHPHPESAAPIRIRAGAFAPGLPHRDLLVSPDHGVLAASEPEALIPARYLVNGSTIVREPATGMAEYVHVEVDRHDILLAEGLAAESYLDTGNRVVFTRQTGIRHSA